MHALAILFPIFNYYCNIVTVGPQNRHTRCCCASYINLTPIARSGLAIEVSSTASDVLVFVVHATVVHSDLST